MLYNTFVDWLNNLITARSRAKLLQALPQSTSYAILSITNE